MGYQFLPLSGPDSADRSRRARRWKSFAALLFFGMLAGVVGGLTKQAYSNADKITAAAFPWPDECPARTYRPGDRLPKACFTRFQRISQDWVVEHGLQRGGRRRGKTVYYRLGNDAVHPMCLVWEESCTIKIVYPDVFVIDSRIADVTSAGWETAGESGQR